MRVRVCAVNEIGKAKFGTNSVLICQRWMWNGKIAIDTSPIVRTHTPRLSSSFISLCAQTIVQHFMHSIFFLFYRVARLFLSIAASDKVSHRRDRSAPIYVQWVCHADEAFRSLFHFDSVRLGNAKCTTALEIWCKTWCFRMRHRSGMDESELCSGLMWLTAINAAEEGLAMKMANGDFLVNRLTMTIGQCSMKRGICFWQMHSNCVSRQSNHENQTMHAPGKNAWSCRVGDQLDVPSVAWI